MRCNWSMSSLTPPHHRRRRCETRAGSGGRARTVCRACYRFGLVADALDYRREGGLRLLDRTTLPRVPEPALDLLVALTPRLRPEVVAEPEADDERNPISQSHACHVPRAAGVVHMRRVRRPNLLGRRASVYGDEAPCDLPVAQPQETERLRARRAREVRGSLSRSALRLPSASRRLPPSPEFLAELRQSRGQWHRGRSLDRVFATEFHP
jgi:hypothetical protein